MAVDVPMSAVPLHALVRYPEGPGPFPLVLIVHGNHDPEDPSEPGYDYLLEQLASHCMIAVSVDQNFLNGFVSGEMDARAIVLLRHLQLWREWNRTPGHPFFTKVDLENIGLAGHSRGGEAITVAESYNRTRHDRGDPDHDFDFQIKGLYAIAPVDGQIGGPQIVLREADYFVMHGSHDGDVWNFPGQRTYDRAFPVTEDTERFKGHLFVHGANHGQWNEGWGTTSETPIIDEMDRIEEDDQQAFALTYMTAFFLSSLRGWSEHNALFKGEAAFASVPGGITHVTQYHDPERVFVNHFEEDDDLATGSFPGVTNTLTAGFDMPRDYAFSDVGPPLWLWQQTDGLAAAWEQTTAEELVVQIPDALRARIGELTHLGFRIGQVYEQVTRLNTPGTDMDLSIQLGFGAAGGPTVVASDYASLPYPDGVSRVFRRMGMTEIRDLSKTVLQSVRIPLADLETAEQRADSATEIRFRFDRRASGSVALDSIRFTK